jgi:hypothetical protein
VNAQHTKNVPGRKSDVQECPWLLKLPVFGLLNHSFQSTDEIRMAAPCGGKEVIWWPRRAVQCRQKGLTERGVPLSNVLSDSSGVSGRKIIEAILDGEHDPWELAALVEPEVKATAQDLAKSLEGNWREELLFVLRQQVELYRIHQEKIADCDLQWRKHLESLGSKLDLTRQPMGPRPKNKKSSQNAPAFARRTELFAGRESTGDKETASMF